VRDVVAAKRPGGAIPRLQKPQDPAGEELGEAQGEAEDDAGRDGRAGALAADLASADPGSLLELDTAPQCASTSRVELTRSLIRGLLSVLSDSDSDLSRDARLRRNCASSSGWSWSCPFQKGDLPAPAVHVALG
jgi:hypothetical protein